MMRRPRLLRNWFHSFWVGWGDSGSELANLGANALPMKARSWRDVGQCCANLANSGMDSAEFLNSPKTLANANLAINQCWANLAITGPGSATVVNAGTNVGQI